MKIKKVQFQKYNFVFCILYSILESLTFPFQAKINVAAIGYDALQKRFKKSGYTVEPELQVCVE